MEADELIEVVRLPLADAVDLAAGQTRDLTDRSGAVGMADAKSALAVLRAARHLG